jgi:hypothetical protein
MTLRNDIDALRRSIGTPGDCPGLLPGMMTTYRQGEPEPEAPPCPLCGSPHWPEGHTLVCEVVVKTREAAQRWREQAEMANGASSAE